jgi:SAM-dependent methyltransferase
LKDIHFEPDFFDAIVLYHVIEHMNDPLAELKEVRRILKPYGKLIVGTPDFDCGLSKLFGEKFRLLHDSGHISLFSSVGLLRILKDVMFEVEEIRYPFFETEHFTKENLLRLFDSTRVSPPFYGNIITCYAYKK